MTRTSNTQGQALSDQMLLAHDTLKVVIAKLQAVYVNAHVTAERNLKLFAVGSVSARR